MKYIQDLNILKRINYIGYITFGVLISLGLIGGLYEGKLYLFFMAGIVLVRALRQFGKRVKNLQRNSELLGYIEVNDQGIEYSEGEGGYRVLVQPEEVESVKGTTFLFLNKITLKISDNRKLVFWNIEEYQKAVAGIESHVTKQSKQVTPTA